MTNKVERLRPITEIEIGVFCDNTAGHSNGRISFLGSTEAQAKVGAGYSFVTEVPGINPLRTLVEYHESSSPSCSESHSYFGLDGSKRYIIPKSIISTKYGA